MNDWPSQIYGTAETVGLIEAGERAVCLTSPTGGGKTRIMQRLIEWAQGKSWRTVLYTNRKLLREQTTDRLNTAGIKHGIRAAGWEPEHWEHVQVSSVQTELSRVYQQGKWSLHQADLVLIDEAHLQKSTAACRIIADHQEHGAAVVGVTATPLGIGHIYTKLVVAGVNSELRKCGALVPCYTYGPDEPDMRRFKPSTKTGEFTEGDKVKAIMTPTIFARVYENWCKLNKDARPTILFGPNVGGSLWFAEQFYAKGVRSAHIDGEDVWIDGKSYKSTREGREDIIAGSKDGSIKVICNRFVLREGLDLPWLYHGIFATVMGSLQSFLQSGGRLLRAYPGLDHVCLQDHGGHWWRHGSLNADRHWDLGCSEHTLGELRKQQFRDKAEPEPIVCPKCFCVRLAGPKCPKCGHEPHRKSRMVVQTDGSLKQMYGDVYKQRKVLQKSDTQKKWEQCYWRCRKSGRTFNQAEGLFFHENHYYPPRNLPMMPLDPMDWHRKIETVPRHQLHQEGVTA